MKKFNIGVITYPGECESERASLQLSCFFSEILMPFCGSLNVITGDISEIKHKAIRIIKVPFHESGSHSLLSRISKYVLPQLRILPKLVKISRSCDTIIFFSLAELYTGLIFITKFFLMKKVIIVHCGLTSKSLEIAYNKKILGFGVVVSYFTGLLEKASFFLADRITVESESIIEAHRLRRYEGNICICNSDYIDTNAFKIKRDIGVRRNLVGYIGRFGKDKGVTNFAQAIGKIDNFEDIEFLMVGGSSSEFSKIEEILNQNKIQHKVTLVGYVSYQNIPDYLNELKLLVLPSYGEGLPATILEAMACGTPVLATPVGGIPDVVRDEETGFILENNSPECIAKNIMRVLEHPKLGEVIKKARDLIEREYTYEPTVKKWRKVFDLWGD